MDMHPGTLASSLVLSLVALFCPLCLAQATNATSSQPTSSPLELGQRRELLVDLYLVEKLTGSVRLQLHEPRDEGAALRLDAPWEGPFCGYTTVLYDLIGGAPRYRMYYRGKAAAVGDGTGEVTCVAESSDGIRWTKPKLGLVEIDGSRENNVVLADADPFCHNFSPLIDTNPTAPAEQRYKALAGINKTGLVAFVSPDGLRWKKLREEPVLAMSALPQYANAFDSQNIAFWSEQEGKYLAYFRVLKDKIRRIARAESSDFANWTNIQLMEYRTPGVAKVPIEHLYTNQTHPYFRAPHLLVGTAARFMPKRQVLTDEEAQAINVNPRYFKDTSDAVLLTTRGGDVYDRTFLSALVRPGIGAGNWVSRTNYPALNVVPTGATEMSLYVNQDYAQPTAHVRRYSLRLDGFASARADYAGGTLLTKPMTFSGGKLLLNFSTSAAGGIRVEILDEAGDPIPGFTAKDSVESIGNEIERAARWKHGTDVSALAGKVVRLRFVMKDADLYAIRFAQSSN